MPEHAATGCRPQLPLFDAKGPRGVSERDLRGVPAPGCTWLFVEAPGGGGWAWYTAPELPAVLSWLDSGSNAERALAEDIHEAFQPALGDLQASACLLLSHHRIWSF